MSQRFRQAILDEMPQNRKSSLACAAGVLENTVVRSAFATPPLSEPFSKANTKPHLRSKWWKVRSTKRKPRLSLYSGSLSHMRTMHRHLVFFKASFQLLSKVCRPQATSEQKYQTYCDTTNLHATHSREPFRPKTRRSKTHRDEQHERLHY
jgi:hypothetical protein